MCIRDRHFIVSSHHIFTKLYLTARTFEIVFGMSDFEVLVSVKVVGKKMCIRDRFLISFLVDILEWSYLIVRIFEKPLIVS